MRELLEALKALERLGATWKTRRVTKKFLFDTIECTALVQTREGVLRGFVEVQRWNTYCRTKMEVTCFLGAKLEADGKFKHSKHPKNETVKIFEYDSEMLYHCSKAFGIKLGYRPDSRIPTEHQFLVEFTEKLVIVVDQQEQAVVLAKATEDGARKSANETRARHALFG